jgi:dynein heavy chain
MILKMKIPIDTLAYDFKIIIDGDKNYDLKKAPDIGCYIYGCFLEGCRFDQETATLADSEPKILFTKMPYIWLIPMIQKDIVKGHVSLFNPLSNHL